MIKLYKITYFALYFLTNMIFKPTFFIPLVYKQYHTHINDVSY